MISYQQQLGVKPAKNVVIKLFSLNELNQHLILESSKKQKLE